MKNLVSASLLACNKEKIIEEVSSLQQNGVDIVHFDVMDGKFVNNISFNDDTFHKIRKYTTLPFEIHLMVNNPLEYISKYEYSSNDVIIVHYEAFNNDEDVISCLEKINLSHKSGISFKPHTDITKIDKFLPYVDYVLVMSVEPGFGGQSFIENSVEKIKYFASKKKSYHYVIEVDGGINDLTYKKCVEAGVDILVSGSFLFKGDMVKKVEAIKCEK